MFQCVYCNYASIHKHNVTKHVKRMHANNTAPPTTINAHPTQLGSGNIITNEHTSRCELDPSQVYNSSEKTVSIEEYNKANEIAHGWKSAYDNLYNQTGSGIFTQGDVDEVHKRGVEAIRNWQIELEMEKEKKKQLKEELHYEKVAKEYLPIHMNDRYLNIISILRGVKKVIIWDVIQIK